MPRRIRRDQSRAMKRTPRRKFAREQFSSERLNEKIQKKAYELYEKRGYAHGNDWADWFEAERLVKSKKS